MADVVESGAAIATGTNPPPRAPAGGLGEDVGIRAAHVIQAQGSRTFSAALAMKSNPS